MSQGDVVGEYLSAAARSDLAFWYHDPACDPADELPGKQKRLRDFLALDPHGAGGPARGYWTAFVPGLENG